jgi:hypothetical protein
LTDDTGYKTGKPGSYKLERRNPSHAFDALKDSILTGVESLGYSREGKALQKTSTFNQEQILNILEYSKSLNDFSDNLIEMMNSCEEIVVEKLEKILSQRTSSKAGSAGLNIKRKYRSIYNQFCQMLLSMFKKWRQDIIKHANVFHEASFNLRENIVNSNLYIYIFL